MGVFEGLEIVEFSLGGIGPITGKFFADYGATVILVESISHPNFVRLTPPYKDRQAGVNRSATWANLNSSKYSVSLNFRHPKGRQIAKQLAARAGVVIDNFTPGVLETLGLHYEELVKVRPDLIMVSLSNFGQTGPYAKARGVGSTMQSYVGFAGLLGWPDREPCNPYGVIPDVITPRFAAAALLAALECRERTGKGQHLDISQVETSLIFLSPAFIDFQANGEIIERMGNRSLHSAPHGVYPCEGEDRWCAIEVCSDEEWQRLCEVMDRRELSNDPRFNTTEQRKRHEELLGEIMAAWTSSQSAEQVMSRLQEAGIAGGVVGTPPDILRDPQLSHRQHFQVLDHPEIGMSPYEGHAFMLEEAPQIRRAPLLGEHNEYVFKQLLGMSDDEYATLLPQGVFD
ncbi:MAG: CaiB/BaiF CoA transferase family protein [Dehalococcoidia bacterium]